MDLKLTNLEARAVMSALLAYQKSLEKGSRDDKGLEIEKKTVNGLIERLEDMPGGEVP